MSVRAAVLAALVAAALVAPGASAAGRRRSPPRSRPQPARFGDVSTRRMTVRARIGRRRSRTGFSPFEVLRASSTSTRQRRGRRHDVAFRPPVPRGAVRAGPGHATRLARLVACPRRLADASLRASRPCCVEPARDAEAGREPRAVTSCTRRLRLPRPIGSRRRPCAGRSFGSGGSARAARGRAPRAARTSRAERRAPDVQVDPLGRALALVRAARTRPPPDRRRALGLLSRTLRARGEPQRRHRPPPTSRGPSPSPSRRRMTQLVERIEGAS